MLSGGAGLGSYHFGVVSALVKCGLVPKVLAGSSVGSIICAIVATHTDEEIQEFIWQEGKQKLGYLAKRKHDNWVDACTVRFRFFLFFLSYTVFLKLIYIFCVCFVIDY